MIGNLYRPGILWTREVVETLDHDFPSLADGVVIPHGIYDLKRNQGYVNLGTSHDTAQFAVDSLRQWWQTEGRVAYPEAASLLVLCDGGGSNSARTLLFKAELAQLAQEIGLEVRIAHSPPYTSKYNPIEHRLFPHLHRAYQGVILTSTALVKELMAKASTSTGLRVSVNIVETVYQTGCKVSTAVKERLQVVFDEVLPQWNYRFLPTPAYVGEVI